VRQRFAEVILGRASSNCKNFGICRIEGACPTEVFGQNVGFANCNKLYAIGSLKGSKYFELAFLRSTISDLVFKRYFKHSIFIVEEPYTIKKDFIGKPIIINKGFYGTTVLDTFLIVRFILT